MARLDAVISEKVAESLKKTALSVGITKSEVLRQAIIIYAIFHEEIKNGKKICISADGKTVEKELIIL